MTVLNNDALVIEGDSLAFTFLLDAVRNHQLYMASCTSGLISCT